jgi:Meiotically up-regulated gene 113
MPVIRDHLGFDESARQALAEGLEDGLLYTYALTDGRAIKIGKSESHPWVRLKDLQTGNPEELRLVAYTLAVTEAEAHKRLARHRLRGEWFRLVPAVLQEIATWDWLDQQVFAAVRKLAFDGAMSAQAGQHCPRT